MKRLNLFLPLFIAAIFFSNFSTAQSGYLKLGDIKGESTDAKHKDWIIIQSFSQGLSKQSAATGAARMRSAVIMKDFVVTKKIDMSSPKLMEAAVKGQVIPEVILELTTSGRNTFYTVKMTNVLISSYSTSGDTGGNAPVMEEMSLNFEKIEWTYTDSKGGSTTASYNVATNK